MGKIGNFENWWIGILRLIVNPDYWEGTIMKGEVFRNESPVKWGSGLESLSSGAQRINFVWSKVLLVILLSNVYE